MRFRCRKCENAFQPSQAFAEQSRKGEVTSLASIYKFRALCGNKLHTILRHKSGDPLRLSILCQFMLISTKAIPLSSTWLSLPTVDLSHFAIKSENQMVSEFSLKWSFASQLEGIHEQRGSILSTPRSFS